MARRDPEVLVAGVTMKQSVATAREMDEEPRRALRLECLRLASSAAPGEALDDVMARADRYYAYVLLGMPDYGRPPGKWLKLQLEGSSCQS